MTWHWSYKALPELAGLPTAERRRVFGRARRRARRRAAYWLPAVGGLAATAGLVMVWPFGLMALVGRPGAVTVTGGLVVAYALVAAVAWAVPRAQLLVLRPFILRELPGRCRGCGYDLTGNKSGACPECGRAAGPDAQGLPASGGDAGAA